MPSVNWGLAASSWCDYLYSLFQHSQSQPSPTETVKKTEHSLRVLVVDDNVDHAHSAAILLRAYGHEVREAYSGKATLEAALEFQPHVVLLDIGLPEIDGYEVARRLRHDPRTKDVRLIALTGYGMEADRKRSVDAGFDDHLVKPVDPGKLQELLSKVGRRDNENKPM